MAIQRDMIVSNGTGESEIHPNLGDDLLIRLNFNIFWGARWQKPTNQQPDHHFLWPISAPKLTSLSW